MGRPLREQIVVVTGASIGVGRAIALAAALLLGIYGVRSRLA